MINNPYSKHIMASVRKSFLFNIEWVEVLDGYPTEVRHEVLDGVLEYVRSGKIINMKPLAKMAFSFIKRELDYNNERYESMVSKRSEAGRKGGLSKGKTVATPDEGSESDDLSDDNAEANASFAKQMKQSQANEANACFAKQTEANEANACFAKHNDNEYDYDNDIRDKEEGKTDAGASSTRPPERDSEQEDEPGKPEKAESVPYAKIRDLWNESCKALNAVHVLSKSRKAKISVRITEMGGVEKAMETITELFRKVSESKFLNGDNDRSWKASFDWVFENDKNWIKVMEGNYDNREPSGGRISRMDTNMTNFNNEGKHYEQF